MGQGPPVSPGTGQRLAKGAGLSVTLSALPSSLLAPSWRQLSGGGLMGGSSLFSATQEPGPSWDV